MDLIILSDKFYNDYQNCPEILQKKERPYACVIVRTGGVIYAVPLRHHIRHKYAFHTVGDAGLDYSKTVIISDPLYLSGDTPTIDSKEHSVIIQRETMIRTGLQNYIKLYKKAARYSNNKHYANILKYSTLKYFEKYLP